MSREWVNNFLEFITYKENDKHDKRGRFAPNAGGESSGGAKGEDESARWYLHKNAKTDAERYARYKKGAKPPAHFNDEEKKVVEIQDRQ